MEPQPQPPSSWFLSPNGLTVLVAIPIQIVFALFLIAEVDHTHSRFQSPLFPLFLFHLFPGLILQSVFQEMGFPASGILALPLGFLGGIPVSLLYARILCIFFRPFIQPTGKPLVRIVRLIPGLILLWFLSLWGWGIYQDLHPSRDQIARRDLRGFQILIQNYLLTRRPLPAGDPADQLRTLLEGNRHRHGHHLKIDESRLASNGLYLDPWGSPYAFGWWETPFQRTRAWAYSFGPNTINEGGNGDDIASWR